MGNVKPLEGLKVVEWTTFIAAPVCGRLLADWGAEVIKVETPEGDYWRIYGPKLDVPATEEENPLFDITNANKRGITLNLRTKEGCEIMEKLIAQSDIMLTNTRERVLKKLGFDYDSLSKRYPGLIYAQLSGYGDEGPEAHRPGYDTVSYWSYGGFLADQMVADSGSMPINIPTAMADVASGSMLFGAIMAALNGRQRTGKGDKVSVSLFGNAIWTMGFMGTLAQPRYGYKYPRKRTDARPTSTTYKCKDGEYITIAAVQYNRDFKRLCTAMGLEELIDDPRYKEYDSMMLIDENRIALLNILEQKFLEKTAAEWDVLFEEVDMTHDVCSHYKDVFQKEQARANHFVEEVTFRNGEKAWLPRPSMVSDNLGIPEYKLAPLMGENSFEIMEELGYTADEIREMHEKEAFYGREHKPILR